jgi:hypothetical protein
MEWKGATPDVEAAEEAVPAGEQAASRRRQVVAERTLRIHKFIANAS